MITISKLVPKLSGSRLRTLVAQAKHAQRDHQWSLAAQKYSEALVYADNKFKILVQLGHMQKESEDYASAEKSYLAALALTPTDWDLHIQLGHLFNRAGKPTEALDWYSKALTLRPYDASTKAMVENVVERTQGRAVEILRQQTLAEMDSRQFEKALPNVENLFYNYRILDFDVILGHAYRELGKYDAAETIYKKYLKRSLDEGSKNVFDAYFQIGNIGKLTGNYTMALSYYIDAKNYKNRTEKFLDTSNPIIGEINWCMERLYPVLKKH